jgi:hypothetical protein
MEKWELYKLNQSVNDMLFTGGGKFKVVKELRKEGYDLQESLKIINNHLNSDQDLLIAYLWDKHVDGVEIINRVEIIKEVRQITGLNLGAANFYVNEYILD